MHFSKVFALLSLAAVSTALPNSNPYNPSSQPVFNCNTNVAQQACCQNEQDFNKDHAGVAPKLKSALNAPTSNNGGGLLGGLLGGIFPNLLAGSLDNLVANIPTNIPIGLECSLEFDNCNARPTCCNFGTQADTQENAGLLSGLLKLGNVNICSVDLL
ncbi:uncharacterized protein K444DRAFT_658327 [Hyaloscypha bicolor E]|uniref:Hydrophobin n=1 Tax=Hyaloscypha bicolor E TaxID=1095630 RepID=A0A2J6TW58_9HELO|nr:uncharacterized protein K444DRAFT_658327 [Hyaloscypha bicolor E]PMD67237.1 hypothetical protein K444DRAFT_658327 [Hyaloscypha bicolor E]